MEEREYDKGRIDYDTEAEKFYRLGSNFKEIGGTRFQKQMTRDL